ncbi:MULTISPECIES: B12-binding domain-containing radical SAM protein [unclassified Streptomyces]|uniref:B12-binding domain-containing radical SAM protein n=1 Tax=unclassified Streptomyces TaxID=2593676 RepID=UPI00228596D9|nr:radical SAM protein [Streptomyces sp. Je 1-369]WAL96997.1 B12-binding domain-containing radical SAM protein [Streptomyces sp. Je 1-369]
MNNRGDYWTNFDSRYIAAHPNVQPMRKILWELPHWVPWLAAVIEQAGFDSMEALDFYGDCAIIDGIDEPRIHDRLTRHPADVYLFSPMTINLPQALRIAEMVKEIHPRARTIFGGVVATPLYEEVARHPAVDYVVRDRGEYALPELLLALRDGGDLSALRNLAYETPGGELAVSKLHPYIPVEDIPFPKVDIFPKDTGQDLRYIRQNYALGCPFTCDFCTIQTIGRKPMYFSPDRVLAEVAAYREQFGKHHHVYFGDETFTANTQRTLDICSALERDGTITYDAQTRLNCLRDTRLPKALYDSGCRWMEIGLESASADTQHAFKQHTKLDPLEETLARLRDAGLPTCSYLIMGLPNEKPDDMRRTIDWACSLIDRGLLYASYLSLFVPYPGTPMFDHPERYGMKLLHRQYDLYNEELPPVVDTKHATSEEVYDIFVEGVGMLAQAMGRAPALTFDHAPSQHRAYGEFWRAG